MKAGLRVLFCLIIALLVFGAVVLLGLEILTSIMLAWDAFCLLMIVVNWVTLLTVPQQELCKKAQQEDESRSITFALVCGIVCVSLIGILVLMKSTDGPLVHKGIHRAISLLGVALSWILLHTIFTLRYAHLYYGGDAADAKVGGLAFPEDDAPDYLDFAYFSFVLGMTFQVSDVEISSKLIRRVALLHGFISFVFNTTIVALTISIVPNLGK